MTNITIPRLIEMGDVFLGESIRTAVKLFNPTRRDIFALFSVDREYRDIFLVDGGLSKFKIPSRTEGGVISITFTPQIDRNYQVQASFETDLGKTMVDISGNGVRARVDVTCESFDFGVVGKDLQEFRLLSIANPTSIAIMLRLELDHEDFGASDLEVYLLPAQQKNLKVTFLPISNTAKKCNFRFKRIEIEEEFSEVLFDGKIYSSRKEIELLSEVCFTASGGDFGFSVNNQEVDTADAKMDRNATPPNRIPTPKASEPLKSDNSSLRNNNTKPPSPIATDGKSGSDLPNRVEASTLIENSKPPSAPRTAQSLKSLKGTPKDASLERLEYREDLIESLDLVPAALENEFTPTPPLNRRSSAINLRLSHSSVLEDIAVVNILDASVLEETTKDKETVPAQAKPPTPTNSTKTTSAIPVKPATPVMQIPVKPPTPIMNELSVSALKKSKAVIVEDLKSGVQNMPFNFGKITNNKQKSLPFPLKNTGDVPITLMITDSDGLQVTQPLIGILKKVKCVLPKDIIKIAAHSKESLKLTVHVSYHCYNLGNRCRARFVFILRNYCRLS